VMIIIIIIIIILGHSEPAPTSAPSTGCPLLLSCGWTSTQLELIFGFTLVINLGRKIGLTTELTTMVS
jgi:hypothetical protein